VHPSCVATFQRGPNAGTHRGRDAVQAILEDQLAPFDSWIVEPEEFVEGGDQTVVIVKTRAQPKGSSREIENRNGHLWMIRDGKIVSLETFPEPDKALQAAGLRQ
jgi:ketosteroid isomerase-like protein